MLNFDAPTLDRFESHRGVGYLAFAASVFAPSILTFYFTSLDLMREALLLAVVVASAGGVAITTVAIVALFFVVLRPEEPDHKERIPGLGGAAIGIGSGLALFVQLLVLIWMMRNGEAEFLFREFLWNAGLAVLLLVIAFGLVEWLEVILRKRR